MSAEIDEALGIKNPATSDLNLTRSRVESDRFGTLTDRAGLWCNSEQYRFAFPKVPVA